MSIMATLEIFLGLRGLKEIRPDERGCRTLPLLQALVQQYQRDARHRGIDKDLDIDCSTICTSSWLEVSTASQQTSTEVESVKQKTHPCFHHSAMRKERAIS
jgi:hypothetical protein